MEQFAEAWRAPELDFHESLWAPDIALIQPLMGELHGKAECRAGFGRLFELVPDIHGVVHRWATDGEAIFIEFTLSGTFGGKELSWSAVDRFFLDEDGLIVERISYFDSAPLALKMALRPRGWRRMLGTRFVPTIRGYVHP